jgi:hypothetical protein
MKIERNRTFGWTIITFVFLSLGSLAASQATSPEASAALKLKTQSEFLDSGVSTTGSFI